MSRTPFESCLGSVVVHCRRGSIVTDARNVGYAPKGLTLRTLRKCHALEESLPCRLRHSSYDRAFRPLSSLHPCGQHCSYIHRYEHGGLSISTDDESKKWLVTRPLGPYRVWAHGTRDRSARVAHAYRTISDTGRLYTYHSLMSISSRFLLTLLQFAPFFRAPLNGCPDPAAPSNAAFGS